MSRDIIVEGGSGVLDAYKKRYGRFIYPHSTGSETARSVELYNAIMEDLAQFGVRKPPLEIVPWGTLPHVEFMCFMGIMRAKAVRLAAPLPRYLTPEYATIHEVAHLVEVHMTGSSDNEHGDKYNKHWKLLLDRYGMKGYI